MFPEVLEALLDRVPHRSPVTVESWRTAALPGRVYPALVRAPGRRADGMLLTGLTTGDWTVLDAYEDDLYDLAHLDLREGGQAWTYVAPDGGPALDEDWSAAEFAGHLDRYVANCRAWRVRYEAAADGGAGSE